MEHQPYSRTKVAAKSHKHIQPPIANKNTNKQTWGKTVYWTDIWTPRPKYEPKHTSKHCFLNFYFYLYCWLYNALQNHEYMKATSMNYFMHCICSLSHMYTRWGGPTFRQDRIFLPGKLEIKNITQISSLVYSVEHNMFGPTQVVIRLLLV